MPKTLFQDIVYTAIMASIMVYGMIVYNIVTSTGGLSGGIFLAALFELPIMIPVAFVLEILVVGRLSKKTAFTIVRRINKPQFTGYVISFCICMMMCPVMSLIATILFKDPSPIIWAKAWILNLPMALLYQFFFCGPLVRFVFRKLFPEKPSADTELSGHTKTLIQA